MENSYCGKNCEDCLDKADVGCPGCKLGPGKPESALCKIAKCCEYKETDGCGACASNLSCSLLAGRESMLQQWNGRSRETAAASAVVATAGTVSTPNGEQWTGRSRNSQDAPFIRKSLIALFWLFLIGGIGNVVFDERILGMFPPVVLWAGALIGFGISIAQGVVMVRLGREERTYKVAGICSLIANSILFVADIIITVVNGMIDNFSGLVAGVIALIFAILLMLGALVLAIISGYKFLKANARLVEWRDPDLSARWIAMSKWYFGIFLGILVIILFAFLMPLLALIVMLVYLLGVLAFGVCEYVFIYQTANRFKE